MSIYIIGVVIAWIVLTADDFRTGHFAPIGALMVALCWPLFVGMAAIFLIGLIPLLMLAIVFHGVPALWRYFMVLREERRGEG